MSGVYLCFPVCLHGVDRDNFSSLYIFTKMYWVMVNFVKIGAVEAIHSFIYSTSQRSSKVDIELVIKITIGTVQNES